VDLLGSRIGWVEGELFRELCVRYGISEECEVVMVQISALTECHLHRVGASTFMVLGKRDVIIPKAEILLGDYSPGETDFSLVRLPAVGGKVFEIPAGKIHAFVASEPALTLIGVVNPRIRNGDEFDIVPFEYLSAQPYVVKLEDSK
jgi:hypothetical protein